MRNLIWTAVTSLTLLGCTRVTDFDRTRISRRDAASPGDGGSLQDGSAVDAPDAVSQVCDLEDHSGCDDDQLCCADEAAPPACQDVGPSQCTACGVACDPTSSSACVDRQCRCGDGPSCSGETPLCDHANGRCVRCLSDADCSGTTPICGADGTCEACSQSPDNCPDPSVCLPDGSCMGCGVPHIGCDNPTPVCDGALNRCRACERDDDCSAFGGDRTFCTSEGTCATCDDETHSGCERTTPFCGKLGDEFRCLDCSADPRGAICGDQICDRSRESTEPPSCQDCSYLDASKCPPDKPHCDDAVDAPGSRTCVACRDHGDCPVDKACVDNVCVDCSDNTQCLGHAVGPVCAAGDCEPCDPTDDDGCASDQVCVAGTPNVCQRCDPADDSGCTGGQRCSAGAVCVECLSDGDCTGSEQCVGGSCRACDPDDDAGCGTTTQPAQCAADFRCICAADEDCTTVTGKPNCDVSTGVCHACVDNADCAGEQCVDNVCQACDPADDAGCAGQQCVLDSSTGAVTCRACDPVDDAGCGTLILPARCDGSSFTCTCESDADCATVVGRPHCATGAGACVECRTDIDCPADKPLCEGNACLRCSDPLVTGDADMRCDARGAGTTCDTTGGATDGQCVI